jgi:hypothetical protein
MNSRRHVLLKKQFCKYARLFIIWYCSYETTNKQHIIKKQFLKK